MSQNFLRFQLNFNKIILIVLKLFEKALFNIFFKHFFNKFNKIILSVDSLTKFMHIILITYFTLENNLVTKMSDRCLHFEKKQEGSFLLYERR